MRDPRAFYEVLFKVSNRPDADERTSFMDGQPIAIKPRGAWMSPGEFKLWIETGSMSVGARAVMNNGALAAHQRVRARTLAILEHDDRAEALALKLEVELVAAKGLVESAKKWINSGMTLGYDTNWGYADLTVQGSICLEMTPTEAEELMAPMVAPIGPLEKYDELAKRSHRIAYESVFHAEKVDALMNPRVYVPVDRVTFVPYEKAVRPYLAKQTA